MMKQLFFFFLASVVFLLHCMDEYDSICDQERSMEIVRIEGFQSSLKNRDLIRSKKILDSITKNHSMLPDIVDLNSFFACCSYVLKKQYLLTWIATNCYDPKYLFDMIYHEKTLLSIKKQCFFRWIENQQYKNHYDLKCFFHCFKDHQYKTYYEKYENIKLETLECLEQNGYSLFDISSIKPISLLLYFIKKGRRQNVLSCMKNYPEDLFLHCEDTRIKNFLYSAGQEERIEILKLLFDVCKNQECGLFKFIFNWHFFDEAQQLWLKNIQDEQYKSCLIPNLIDDIFQQGGCCTFYLPCLFKKEDRILLLKIIMECFLRDKDVWNGDQFFVEEKQFDMVLGQLLDHAKNFQTVPDLCDLTYQFVRALFDKHYEFKDKHILSLLDIFAQKQKEILKMMQDEPSYVPIFFKYFVDQKNKNIALYLFEKMIMQKMIDSLEQKRRTNIINTMPAFLTLLDTDSQCQKDCIKRYQHSIFYDPMLFLRWIVEQNKTNYFDQYLESILDALRAGDKKYDIEDLQSVAKIFSYDITTFLYQECLSVFCSILKTIRKKEALYTAIFTSFPSIAHENLFFLMIKEDLLEIDYKLLCEVYFKKEYYSGIKKLWEVKKDTLTLDYIKEVMTQACKDKNDKTIQFLFDLMREENNKELILFLIDDAFSTNDTQLVKTIFTSWENDDEEVQTQILICALNNMLLHCNIQFLELPILKETYMFSEQLFKYFCSEVFWEEQSKLSKKNSDYILNFLSKKLGVRWCSELFYYFIANKISFRIIKTLYYVCNLREAISKDSLFSYIKKLVKKKNFKVACYAVFVAFKLNYINSGQDLTNVIEEKIKLFKHTNFDYSLNLLKIFSKYNITVEQKIDNLYFLGQFSCPDSFRKYGFVTSKDNIDGKWHTIDHNNTKFVSELLQYFQRYNIKNFNRWKMTHHAITTEREKNSILMKQIPLVVLQNKYYKRKNNFQRIGNFLSFLCDYSQYADSWEKYMSYWIKTIVEKLIYTEKGSKEEREIRTYLHRCLLLKTRIDMSYALLERKTVLYKLAQHGYFEEFDLLKSNFFSKEEFKTELKRSQENNFKQTDGSVMAVIKDRIIDLQDKEDPGVQKELDYWRNIIDQFGGENLQTKVSFPVLCIDNHDDQSVNYV